MRITIDPDISAQRALAPLISNATPLLEQVIGASHLDVMANWSLEKDAVGHPRIQLTLTDFSGDTVQSRFVSEDLANRKHLEARLYRIWGDLLQSRSHRQLRNISGEN